MPIYEYRCSACDFEEEYLQKVGADIDDLPQMRQSHVLEKAYRGRLSIERQRLVRHGFQEQRQQGEGHEIR